jgi:hypothetical protein
MSKTWEQMSQPEKIEDLRRDVVRIFALLREFQDAIASDQSAAKSQIEGMRPWGPLLNDIHHRLHRVEKHLDLAK